VPFSNIRAVLFDAGNTLAHLDYAFIAGLLAEHGFECSPLDVRRAEYTARAAIDRELAPAALGAVPFDQGVEALLWPDADGARPSYFAVILRGLGVGAEREAPILEALQAHNRETCLWRVVEPDTPAVLAELRARGFTLAVVSNADGRVEADLTRYGLGSYFAAVLDSHVVGAEKPAPRIFQLALERIGTAPAYALYVGDVFSIDVLGARAAGLAAILFDGLGRYPGSPDCPRIGRLADLLEVLPPRIV
jgi:putative hydrolase of the HAD superfamily